MLKPQNAIYWHWEMQSWLARFIGGKPTLERPRFENKDEGPDDKKDRAAKPAEEASAYLPHLRAFVHGRMQ